MEEHTKKVQRSKYESKFKDLVVESSVRIFCSSLSAVKGTTFYIFNSLNIQKPTFVKRHRPDVRKCMKEHHKI